MSKKSEQKAEIQKDAPAGALAAYGKYAGRGFEGTTSEDLVTPFVKLLQGLSPEITDGMEGAKIGMFFNTASQELIPGNEGIVCVPIKKIHHFVEWRPREAGGGFVGIHSINSKEVAAAIALNGGNRFGKLKTPAKDKDGQDSGFNDLIESHDVFVMLLDETGTRPTGETAVVAFTSTKIKPCKQWWTKIYTLKMPNLPDGNPAPRPPLFAFRTRIVAFKDPRTSKGVFFNVRCDPFVEGNWFGSLVQDEAVLDTAVGYLEAFERGTVKPNYEAQTNTDAEDTEGEKVPF